MSAHTPGPWTACDPDFFGGIAINGPDGGLAIAAVCNGEMRKMAGQLEEHQANARLIAAAPDLLGALKNAVHELNAIRAADGAPRGVDRDYFGALVDNCFDVIAAAEGNK
jgi:hypothetical protein